jgi:hypothetical protein
MKTALKYLSFAGLLLILGASALVFAGVISRHAYYVAAFFGTLAWFGAVPFWMKRRLHEQ